MNAFLTLELTAFPIDTCREVLQLKKFAFFMKRGRISDCNFINGSTGGISLGGGSFLFSEDVRNENGNGTDIYSYKLYPEKGFIKEEIQL